MDVHPWVIAEVIARYAVITHAREPSEVVAPMTRLNEIRVPEPSVVPTSDAIEQATWMAEVLWGVYDGDTAESFWKSVTDGYIPKRFSNDLRALKRRSYGNSEKYYFRLAVDMAARSFITGSAHPVSLLHLQANRWEHT